MYEVSGASKQQMKKHGYFIMLVTIFNQYLSEQREYEVRQPI